MRDFPTLSMWPKPANQIRKSPSFIDIDPKKLAARRSEEWVDAALSDEKIFTTTRRKPSRSAGSRAAKLSGLPGAQGLRALLEGERGHGAWALLNSPDEALLIADNDNASFDQRTVGPNVDRRQNDKSIVPSELDLRRCIGRPMFVLPEEVLRRSEGIRTVRLEQEYDRRMLREALRVAAAEGLSCFDVDGLRFAYRPLEQPAPRQRGLEDIDMLETVNQTSEGPSEYEADNHSKSNVNGQMVAVRANELLAFRQGKGWAPPKIDYGSPGTLDKKTLEQPSVIRVARGLLKGVIRSAQSASPRLPKTVSPPAEGWNVCAFLTDQGVDRTVPFNRARENAGLAPVMRDMRPGLPYGPDKAVDLFMAGFVAPHAVSPLIAGDPPQLAGLLRQELEAAFDELAGEDQEAFEDLQEAETIADMAPRGFDGSERTLRRLGILRTAKAMAAANEIIRRAA